jgi:cytochrome c oxidase assembly protein subunit 15
MVDWKPHGGLPPRSDAEWHAEFEKYKRFPEYQRSNKSMTLDEFKFIYAMEYGHRMLGRFVGVMFVLPALVFAARRRLTGRLARRCVALGLLGGAQGAIGWWMVKSGLSEELLVRADQPRVSPYRLTVHLCMAFSLYAGLVWTAMDIFRATRPRLGQVLSNALAQADLQAALRLLARRSHMAAGFIGLTVVAGALVAGNDAGWVGACCLWVGGE